MTSSRRRINSLIHDRSRSTSPSATRCIATFSKAAPPVVAELGESERKRGGTRLRQRARVHPERTRHDSCVKPRPVIWKPRYATRRMRENAWAKGEIQREGK